MRTVVFLCMFTVFRVSAGNQTVDEINGEVIKIDIGKKKSCNCDKRKSEAEKQKEREYAENASKVMSASFLNAENNKDLIDECFTRMHAKEISIDDIIYSNHR